MQRRFFAVFSGWIWVEIWVLGVGCLLMRILALWGLVSADSVLLRQEAPLTVRAGIARLNAKNIQG